HRAGRRRGSWPGFAASARAADGAQHREGSEIGRGECAAADPDVDRYPPLLSPVDVLEIEQQGKLVNDQREAGAVADRNRGMPALPLAAADGNGADSRDHADAPHVVVQVLSSDAEVAERPPAG